MVTYALATGSPELFDPAVGGGAFLRAARRICDRRGRPIKLQGREIDPDALLEAAASGVGSSDLAGVEVRDFLLDPPTTLLHAIVANPPYIRHHRVPGLTKQRLRRLAVEMLGKPLDGRAGLHIYFLLLALRSLRPGGRLCFILPADSCEGVFASPLWSWISRNFRIDAVATFHPAASPFPGVDTNAVILFIENSAPNTMLAWARCLTSDDSLRIWVERGFTASLPGVEVTQRDVLEAVTAGLSRPRTSIDPTAVRLGDIARVVRGVATGANEFFFLTRSQLEAYDLPLNRFIRSIGRTRDLDADEVTHDTLQDLEQRGRPTYLLSLGAEQEENLPASLRSYLEKGVAQDLPQRALIASRRPWYKMESRQPPPLLFAYLGRRNCRFIRNTAGVVPLTGFLCVYPKTSDPRAVESLWRALNSPRVIANLSLVGKSYGGGAVKVEPRGLENLPIPRALLPPEVLPTTKPRAQLSLIAEVESST